MQAVTKVHYKLAENQTNDKKEKFKWIQTEVLKFVSLTIGQLDLAPVFQSYPVSVITCLPIDQLYNWT